MRHFFNILDPQNSPNYYKINPPKLSLKVVHCTGSVVLTEGSIAYTKTLTWIELSRFLTRLSRYDSMTAVKSIITIPTPHAYDT